VISRRAYGLWLAVWLAACSEPPVPSVESQPIVLWSNVDVRGESVPAVDAGAVYNLEQETHIVSAVRKADGALLWSQKLPVTNPNFDGYGLAIANGVLIVGDLDLFGINPTTGSIIWRYSQSAGRNPGFGRLTVSNGVVYCGSTSGHIFAVDASTGAEKWIAQPIRDTASIYNPVVLDGVVYAGVTRFGGGSPNRAGAVALDAATGSQLWLTLAPPPASNASDENTGGVAVIGESAFFGSGTGVHVLNKTSGQLSESFSAEVLADAGFTPHRVFSIGSILLVASGAPASVTAVDPVSLKRQWQVSTTSSVSSISGDANVAYIPQQGALAAVSLQSGQLSWRFKSESVGHAHEEFLAAPAFDLDRVYLPGFKGIYGLKRN
jgi:outer membrane protein assembly factor BamB